MLLWSSNIQWEDTWTVYLWKAPGLQGISAVDEMTPLLERPSRWRWSVPFLRQKALVLIGFKMVDAKNTSSPKSPVHFVDANQTGKIMYIQQPKGLYSACFGGLMAMRSHTLGAAGIVIDGRFRDIQEIQELGLPVRQGPTSSFDSASSLISCSYLQVETPLSAPIRLQGLPNSIYLFSLKVTSGYIQGICWLAIMMEWWSFPYLWWNKLLPSA